MTEREWLEGTDPGPMLEYLCRQLRMTRVKSGRRKLRLFACGCCRESLEDRRLQAALEVSERFGDGEATRKELAQAQSAAEKVVESLYRAAAERDVPAHRTAWLHARAVAEAAGDGPLEVVVRLVLSHTGLAARAATGEGNVPSDAGVAALQALYRRQCDLLRCLFGNPFRPLPAIKTAWLKWNGGVVPRLAEAAYSERVLPAGTLESARLAILADAFEEAGADDETLLRHLRSLGPHVRGCFAVDLLLQKK
jgi:hypothetical protein